MYSTYACQRCHNYYETVLMMDVCLVSVLIRRGGWRVWPLQSPREKTKRSTRRGVSLSSHEEMCVCVFASAQCSGCVVDGLRSAIDV